MYLSFADLGEVKWKSYLHMLPHKARTLVSQPALMFLARGTLLASNDAGLGDGMMLEK